MPPNPNPATPAVSGWKSLGPGFLVAATGVGAGDLIAAAVVGQRFGLAVLWVVALGALFKAVLNEGVSRWQLATGTTLIEGWTQRLPKWVGYYFTGYLALWAFLVAAALASACGVAAKALWPGSALSTVGWSVVHAAVGYALVRWWGYRGFERLMHGLMAVMFVTVLLCAVLMRSDLLAVARGLFWPGVPAGSVPLLLGAMGGVGGSVTLLCYGYWLREKQWRGASAHRRTMWDLGCAYTLTGFFGLAVVIIAATVKPADASGNALVLALAGQLGAVLGPVGKWCFLAGFWCAVFTSLLGVWQGVPYLWADSMHALRRKAVPANLTTSRAYRWFLLYMAFPPLLLLTWQKPLAIVVLYAIAGAFFMPFLGAVLLWMNNRRDWVGELRNRWRTNLVLVLSLVLFASLFALEVLQRIGAALRS